MKPKTKVMAAATMLSVTIGFGALFIYIEEKKFEATGYQKQLHALQQQMIAEKNGFHLTIQALANNNADIKALLDSAKIQQLNRAQASELASTLRNTSAGQSDALLRDKFDLGSDEIKALQSLSGQQQ